MGQRVVRVNELLKREISSVLHTRYQGDAVNITILHVDTAPNLRAAKVFFATHGDESQRQPAERFFSRNHEAIRREVGRVVTLKYLPHLDFIYDKGADYEARVHDILDSLDEGDSEKEKEI